MVSAKPFVEYIPDVATVLSSLAACHLSFKFRKPDLVTDNVLKPNLPRQTNTSIYCLPSTINWVNTVIRAKGAAKI